MLIWLSYVDYVGRCSVWLWDFIWGLVFACWGMGLCFLGCWDCVGGWGDFLPGFWDVSLKAHMHRCTQAHAPEPSKSSPSIRALRPSSSRLACGPAKNKHSCELALHQQDSGPFCNCDFILLKNFQKTGLQLAVMVSHPLLHHLISLHTKAPR